MNRSARIHVSFRAALSLIGRYVRLRITEQVKSVAFIVLYLAAFQILVLGTAPSNAFRISAGIAMVVFGLTLFLEGLILGLMPLGERVGLKLPHRAGLGLVIVFGLLLGVGSTLAEPAVAALRVLGGTVKAWEAPLLFHLLENEPDKLVLAIGVGVGIAVAAGMVRLYFGLSIKPFAYALVPLLLAVSIYCALNDELAAVIGLAWDAGAVTTGAVTVPLVVALGIGVSRAIGQQEGASSGFGIVMLASAFPVLAVLVLGMLLNPAVPEAMPAAEFFSQERREDALRLFASEDALLRHVYQRGDAEARKAFHGEGENYHDTVASLAEPEKRRTLLGDMTLSHWLLHTASEEERAVLPVDAVRTAEVEGIPEQPVLAVLIEESAGALRSVVPLTGLLLAALFFYLRDRVRYSDELVLGIALSLVGMAVLTSGIRMGLAPLGDEVGRSLPRVFRGTPTEEGRILFEPFALEHVFYAYGPDGEPMPHFYLRAPDGTLLPEPFTPENYDPETRRYEHVVKRMPLFRADLTFAGIGLVFLFAFGLGYGSTLAEPALRALGRKVEEISVGTIKSAGVVRAVSLGVGLGLLVGVARILYDLPTVWLLAPPYLLLLVLTWRSEEDFAGIAWDCGGVTTGVVTVPLVMAMGLGIGTELGVVEGFGTLAMASVYPIVTVMVYGLMLQAWQRRSIQAVEEGHDG